MPQHDEQPSERFTLDTERLGEHLVGEYGARRGLDELHEPGGLGGSIRERMNDANDARAISGPDGYEVQIHPRYDGDVILTVNSSGARVACPTIDAKHLRQVEGASFEEGCQTMQWLLDQASPLIGQLRALTPRAITDTRESEDLSLLQRVARELLIDALSEERDDQDPKERASLEEFEGHLVMQADQLASRLHDIVAAFNAERPILPVRDPNAGSTSMPVPRGEVAAESGSSEDPEPQFSDREISVAANRAADDILDAIDAGDEGQRDLANLLVNTTLFYLTYPKGTLTEAIEAAYDDPVADVLEWPNH